jgi:hypothetical protein
MPSIKDAAGDFLAKRRIAVTGVSRSPENHGGNVVEHGITVIDGGCPCMFDPTADVGHKAMRFVFTLNRHVPRQVA